MKPRSQVAMTQVTQTIAISPITPRISAPFDEPDLALPPRLMLDDRSIDRFGGASASPLRSSSSIKTGNGGGLAASVGSGNGGGSGMAERACIGADTAGSASLATSIPGVVVSTPAPGATNNAAHFWHFTLRFANSSGRRNTPGISGKLSQSA